ncbi:TetR/AcrR family transcriptional regulator [Inquilinus limosus]|uniref:TetR/AcrR family transcriptional regulator n=1 Tax=Inquilinus limosus TaxID=171674 RepID=UPI00068E40D1|nr:TetR/AcrR family transcriptional regulator [Inquilinus limosus]
MTCPFPETLPPPAAASRKPDQILKAAYAVFLEQGYEAASMDAIAREAGVSKATLYAHFASKQDLFAAIVASACRVFERLAAMSPPPDDLRAALMEAGGTLLRFILHPDVNKVYRSVVAEAARFPELGRAMYEAGPGQGKAHLARFFAAATERGVLAVPDAELAAEQFGALILGHMKMRLELGIEVPSEERMRHGLESGVDTFLRAYAVPVAPMP